MPMLSHRLRQPELTAKEKGGLKERESQGTLVTSVDTAGIKVIQGGKVVGSGCADSDGVNILEATPIVRWYGSVVKPHHMEHRIIEMLVVSIEQLANSIPPKTQSKHIKVGEAVLP